MTSLHFITASTSGHTDYVVDVLEKYFQRIGKAMEVERQRAEQAAPEDLLRGDIVILGSGTWNTGGIEGQLNMHMHALLMDRAKNIAMNAKPMTFVSLGDERYYFTTRCTEHFLRFQREHGATLFCMPLVLVNEPYGQEEKIEKWGEKFLTKLFPETPAA